MIVLIVVVVVVWLVQKSRLLPNDPCPGGGSPYRPDAHADFDRAFSNDEIFESSYGRYQVSVEEAGELVLPTGWIVACDPGYLQIMFEEDEQPFT